MYVNLSQVYFSASETPRRCFSHGNHLPMFFIYPQLFEDKNIRVDIAEDRRGNDRGRGRGGRGGFDNRGGGGGYRGGRGGYEQNGGYQDRRGKQSA